jgi:MFS family permease
VGSSLSGKGVAALVASRAVYAINWLNVGVLYSLMEPDLKGGVGGLGTLTSSFFLGIGLLQVPGGILAAKYGPKKVVTFGIFLSSVSAMSVALTSQIAEAAMLRFSVGVGMAFVFAPSIVIAANYLGHHRSGLNVGLFNFAFSVGGIFGLFLWTVIASSIGWRLSIALSGGIGIVSGILVLLLVRDKHDLSFKVEGRRLVSIIKDKRLVLLGIGTLSLTTGNNLIGVFMAFYLHASLGVSLVVASIVPALLTSMPILSALLGGRQYDRLKRPRLLMLLADLGMASALVICAVHNLYAAIIGSIFAGLVFGVGLTTAFAAAKDLNHEPKEFDTLAISWVNSLSLFGNFGPPLVFTYLAVANSYSVAWLGGAGMVVLLLLPLLFMQEGISPRSIS